MIYNLDDIRENRTYGIADDIACPEWEQAEACHTSDEADDGYTLVPSSIGKFQIVRILNLAIQNLTNNTQNINGCHNDRGTSDNGCHTVERVRIFERAYEDAHLSNEA